MSDLRPPIRRLLHRAAPAAVVVLCAAALAAAPAATARSVSFTTAPAAATPIDLGLPDGDLGVEGKVEFRTTKAEQRALGIAQRSEELSDRSEEYLAAATQADQRITAIRQLLTEVENDEARLRAEIEERMVDRYKQGGDAADIEFLLSGDGVSDLVARNKVLKDQSARDQRNFTEHAELVAKMETLQLVLEQLRDINGDQARDLQERAGRLDEQLVAVQRGHDEAPADFDAAKAKGVGGTWYIMDGAFQAQLFMPTAGSGYDGGTRTPARKATAAQIQMVLADKRIELDASGVQDVLTGQIDGRLLDAIMAAAQRFNYVKITSLKSDHGVYTASGNVSEHSFGCAADIGTIGKTYITPSSQTPGGEVEQAVRFFMGLGALRPDLAPHQVISLFDLGGASLSMGDHGDHIHVGYSC